MANTFCTQDWDLQAAGCELLPHSEQKTKLISQYVLNLAKELGKGQVHQGHHDDYHSGLAHSQTRYSSIRRLTTKIR